MLRNVLCARGVRSLEGESNLGSAEYVAQSLRDADPVSELAVSVAMKPRGETHAAARQSGTPKWYAP